MVLYPSTLLLNYILRQYMVWAEFFFILLVSCLSGLKLLEKNYLQGLAIHSVQTHSSIPKKKKNTSFGLLRFFSFNDAIKEESGSSVCSTSQTRSQARIIEYIWKWGSVDRLILDYKPRRWITWLNPCNDFRIQFVQNCVVEQTLCSPSKS